MSSREPGTWTDKVYRVRVYHLYADGKGSYLRRTYGPYTTLKAARCQASRLLELATTDNKKALAEVEESPVYWTPTV